MALPTPEALGKLQPTVGVFPAPIESKNPGRAPASTDVNYPIGQEWIYAGTIYVLTAKAAGVATWQEQQGAIPIPLTVPLGGTGLTTITDHGVMVGSGAAAVTPLAVGTNGQVLLGSTGADPVFATLTSSNSSITFTPGAGSLSLQAGATVPLSFTTDSGTATPALNALAVVGGTAIDTSGAGATLTVAFDVTELPALPTSITTDSGTVTPALNTFAVLGGSNIATSGSGANLTIDLDNSPSVSGSLTAGTTVTATLGAITATNGNLVLGTAGNKLSIATGANASVGTATLTGGTVTVNTTAVTASSVIQLTRQSIGATGAAALGHLTVGTVVAGTSFVINAVQAADATALQASDVSVIGYQIIN